MGIAEVKERIVEIIATQLGLDHEEITSEASVVDDLGANSLDVVELIMAIEEEFDIEIPDSEAEKISKVQNIFDYMGTALQAV